MQLHSSDLSFGRAIVIMGVSGSGKSTIGHLLAKALSCPFLDADDFHSEENKEKMKQGIPLTDSDRLPWLKTLRDTLIDYILQGKTVVLACSTLKPSYRQLLRTADFEGTQLEAQSKGEEKREHTCSPQVGLNSSAVEFKELYKNGELNESPKSHSRLRRVLFLLLNGPIELFASRLKERFEEGAHFMPPSLLLSQIDSLAIGGDEDDVFCLDANLSPEVIVKDAKGLVCQYAKTGFADSYHGCKPEPGSDS